MKLLSLGDIMRCSGGRSSSLKSERGGFVNAECVNHVILKNLYVKKEMG
jgi:hypothetical protein